ncbi:AraC family transcriptional regulator [Flavobacterium sp. SM15]|uniref:helix-turn-helix domain-containing protein n=1 Tax=Flavobacterium sp. SM15 TaxID=2908005 RepID=UPI001EDA564E|nr:AraC family transcriptional regulator [Flavobacterium sp. SM15]MCG2611833.1 AraC family transcriptional regulator [Flavobacterium sp. SM15]
MLLEMASGNFDERIPRTTQDDELESVVILVNMLAEEMKESLFPKGYLNLHHLQNAPVSISFITESDFTIREMSFTCMRILGYATKEIQHLSFQDLLTEDCKANLVNLKKSILSNEDSSLLTLTYKSSAGNEIATLFSSIERLQENNGFIIHSIVNHPEIDLPFNEDYHSKRLPKTRRTEAKLMQQVYDYILAHLEAPLPTLKELSRMFGTNEYKLKEGFRHFFNTSIYQFYNDERLKRCYLLIRETTIPLKQIAYMYGFNSYPSFSKAFKKQYGVAPSSCNRK